jgi:endonuclease-3
VTKAEKAKRIGQVLDRMYALPDVPLAHEDPYTLLIAVLLSAQCTDERVNRTTPHLFARARTPDEMVKLSVPEIREIIKPCGLSPQKSKAIHGLSKLLIERHGGKVPRSFDELEALPGVGHKTASVVMAHAFGVPAFPVDTHIHRLAARWGLSSGRNVVQTERDLKELWDEKEWIRRHLQIIYFGREHCPALRHDPSGCPICSFAAPRRATKAGAAKPAASARSGARAPAGRSARPRRKGRSPR